MDRLVIVGPRKAQNELLAAFLKERLSLAADSVLTATEKEIRFRDEGLFLHDCACLDQSGVEEDARKWLQKLPDGAVLALFNVSKHDGVESNLITMGVRGVFFEADTTDTLHRGVAALMGGEVWASRKTLSECLGKTISSSAAAQRTKTDGLLSPREREVLISIARGKSDDHIAEHLCISPHTVKTHLYRVFRKIDVTNRLQAALWAAKNL